MSTLPVLSVIFNFFADGLVTDLDHKSINISLQHNVNILSCPNRGITVFAQNQLFFPSRLLFHLQV